MCSVDTVEIAVAVVVPSLALSTCFTGIFYQDE